MTSGAWLIILMAIVIVGMAIAYLPMQTAAEVMAGTMVIAGGLLGYMAQGRR